MTDSSQIGRTSMKLRDGEQVIAQADFHWSYYIKPLMFSLFLLMFTGVLWIKTPYLVILNFLPLAGAVLNNKTKLFIVTNQRIYLKMGTFSTSRKEIPHSKINDIQIGQNFLQKLLGASTVYIQTGNDRMTAIPHIAHGDKFYEAISQQVFNKAA